MVNTENNCCVIIPIYKDDLHDFEKTSLLRTFDILKDFDVTIICPESLKLSKTQVLLQNNHYSIVKFDDQYFKNIDGYNKLLLSSLFYAKFINYQYILITQLDVYIFKNDLSKWINKDYDYIGAPWIDSRQNVIRDFFRYINRKTKILFNKKPKDYSHINKVGNGGFSLRKTSVFNALSTKYAATIQENLEQKNEDNFHIEDVFWSIQIPLLEPEFKVPGYLEALGFCIDRKPEIALQLNHNKLPFACHGFNKPKVAKFWSKYI